MADARVEFLLARIHEDQHRRWHYAWSDLSEEWLRVDCDRYRWGAEETDAHCTCSGPEQSRLRAEVARLVVALVVTRPEDQQCHDVLRAMVLTYEAHPDYLEAWGE
jgi:hypothetical protein